MTPSRDVRARLQGAIYALALLAIGFVCACSTPTSTNKAVVALQDPNNEAKFVQAGTAAAATAFLANAHNSQYASELIAVADAISLTAAGNPTSVSADDIAGIARAAKVSPEIQNQVIAYGTAALGAFNSAFQLQFPTLKPNYNIFLIAVANGLRIATGGTAQPLPVIPWPPAPTNSTPVA